MMRTDGLGLYVHIPLCVKKCNYCDFCSFPYADVNVDEYVDALCDEIRSYKSREATADTVFFGGGTPSLLSGEQMSRIFSAVRSSFSVTAGAEITMEVNPGTLRYENALDYISLGVNRFSIGLQSIHEKELKILGRIHSYSEFLNSYKLLRSLGADNISVDCMYGIPEQTKDTFADTVKSVCSLAPEHISLYSLILEEGTSLYSKRAELALPSEDEECDMYFDALRILSDYGYEHYEISNYAKRGKKSRHNLKYWHNEEYVGVGVAAYSHLDNKRYANTQSIREYVSGARLDEGSCEFIDTDTSAYEYVMLALRLSEGISLSDYKLRYSRDFLEGRIGTVSELVESGYARLSDGRFTLTDKGMYVSNNIICSLT